MEFPARVEEAELRAVANRAPGGRQRNPSRTSSRADTDGPSTERRRRDELGLLFQAPEPVVTPPRDRRASEPAAAEPAPEEAGLDGIPGAEAAGEAPETAEASEEEAELAGDAPTAGVGGGADGAARAARAVPSRPPAPTRRAKAATGRTASRASRKADEGEGAGAATSRRRTRRRRRSGSSVEGEDGPGVVTKVREPRRERDEVVGLKGSTRLEAKKQRRREGREAGRRRTIITEAEFLARRESVERVMLVRRVGDRTQIGVLEDEVLVEHYVSRDTNVSMAGNIYLGKVQNVLPSMEAAFVDIGKGRNAVLYAGEVNWDAAGLESGAPKRIENALESGQSVLVQVTKDPIGHKGARLTSQISLPGRYLVYVPDSGMTGISRKLPDTERARLKRILRDVVPETAGVIVRTAAEGASEADLRADVERLTGTWEQIRSQAGTAGSARKGKGGPPVLLHGEADLTVRVIRDIFNEDFAQLVVAGEDAWEEVSGYVHTVAPDLADRLTRWTSEEDLFGHHRVDEQIAKAHGPKGLAAFRRVACDRPHRGDDRHRRQHRQVRRVWGQPRGDRHPQQHRGGRGDRAPAAAARHRRDHRHRLHRHGAGVQPRPGRAAAAGMPRPRPHQAPGRRGHVARAGSDDSQAGRLGLDRGVLRDVRALQRAGVPHPE